jgi:hypothetical protein
MLLIFSFCLFLIIINTKIMIKKCLFILFTNFIVNFCLQAQEDQVKFVGDRVYDFGTVENWNNPKAKFIIKNTGFKPFMFLHAYYEEDLKIEFTPEMVYPGEETEVFATYFTIEKGNFNRDFKLSASTTSKPLTLTIKGNIKSFSPNALTVCPRINNEDKKEKRDNNEFLNYKYTIRFLDKETKNPIHDAKITVSAQNGEKLKLETNKKGEIEFNAINGTYSIIGLKDDYKMLKDDLTINANSNESVMYLTPLNIAKANNYSIEKDESKIVENNNKQVKVILKAFDSETKEKLANVKIYIQGKKGESENIETGRNGEGETILKPDAYIITAIKQGYNLLKINEIIDNNNNEINLYLKPFELITNKVNPSKEKDRENELKITKNQEAINKQNADKIEREREQAQKQAEREREMKADAQKEKLEQAKRDRENELKITKNQEAINKQNADKIEREREQAQKQAEREREMKADAQKEKLEQAKRDRENELKITKNQEAINKQNADKIEREREQAQKQAEREREMKADAQKEKLEQAKRDRENELKITKNQEAINKQNAEKIEREREQAQKQAEREREMKADAQKEKLEQAKRDRENELKITKNQEAINKQNAEKIEREREQAQKQAEREREMKADAQKEKLEQAKRDRENELKMAKAEQAEELERQKKLNELKIKQAKEANEIALKQAEKEAKIEQERQEKLAEQKAEYEKKQLEREQKMNESIANKKLDYMITVIDEDTNAPIVDAEVKIVKPNGDKTSENTNKKGAIDISGKAGNYSISIMKPGYNFVQKNIGLSETEAVKQIFVKAIKNNISNNAQPMLSFSNTTDSRPKANDYSKKVNYDEAKSEVKPETKNATFSKNETQPIQNNENNVLASENEKLKLELEKLKMEKENLRLKNELEKLKNESTPISNKNEIRIETEEQQEHKPAIAISTNEKKQVLQNEIDNNLRSLEKENIIDKTENPNDIKSDESIVQKIVQEKKEESAVKIDKPKNSKPKKQIITDELDFFNAIADNKVEIDTNSSLRIRPQMIPKLSNTLYGDNNVLLLIDISKSMKDEGKFNMLKTSLKNLIGALRDVDNIGIIAFNESVKIISEPKSAGNTAYFFDVIDTLSADGRTFGVQGIEKAYEFVQQKFIFGGNNQIIVATDGAFNGPNYSEERLNALIQQHAEQGIKMSILGFNVEREDESLIEKIAKKGKGNYLKVKNPKQAESILIDEIKFQSKKP